MNIAVIGMGGIGGYFGGKLSQLLNVHQEINLFYIARGSHLDEIKKNGLELEYNDKRIVCRPRLATDDFKALPELDYILISVKSYELENVLKQLKPLINSDTVMIPLLNGADIHERVRKVIKTGILLPACVYIISFIEKPGKVKRTSASGVIHLGSENSENKKEKAAAEGILKLFDEAEIEYNWHEDPRVEIWRKFLFIASFALVTADYNATFGEVMESDEMSSMVKDIMSEIKTIADARNIDLPDDVCEKAHALGHKFAFDSTTSFQRDYRIQGKPDERDIFGAAIIRMGAEHAVSTSETEKIYRRIEKNKPL